MAFDIEYSFKGIDGLICSQDGDFWLNNKPIKKQWRRGQVFVLANKKRYGVKTLKKIVVKNEILPF